MALLALAGAPFFRLLVLQYADAKAPALVATFQTASRRQQHAWRIAVVLLVLGQVLARCDCSGSRSAVAALS
jgi:hypothetical protein